MANPSGTALVLAGRQPIGSAGIPYEATVNCFPVKPPAATFHHYDVIEGRTEVKSPRRRHEIINSLQSQAEINRFTPRAVFDGNKNLFAFHEVLNQGQSQMTFAVNMASRPPPPEDPNRGLYKVTVTKVSEIPQRALRDVLDGKTLGVPITTTPLQVLNVLVQQACKLSSDYTTHSRQASFSERNFRAYRGLEMWSGLFNSVRPAQRRLMINVDTATAIMYQRGPLADTVLSYFGAGNARFLTEMNPSAWSELKKFLKDLRVKQAQKNKMRVIKGIVRRAGDYEFNLRDGQPTTVARYFKEEHNYRLQHPDWPGVVSARGEVIPFELCTILLGQQYKRRLSADVTSKVLDFTKKKPEDRFSAIMSGAARLAINSSPYMQQAQMSVGSSLLDVRGRVLDPPTLEYGGSSITPRNGSWNLLHNRLRDPQKIFAWGVACFEATVDINLLSIAIHKLLKVLQSLVIADENPPIQSHNSSDVSRALKDVGNAAIRSPSNAQHRGNPKPNTPPTILIVVLPDSAADIRKAVKQWGDIEMGIPTQCVKAGKMREPGDQYLRNLSLKINAKLGGINVIPRSIEIDHFSRSKAMVIGIDVAHAGPGIQRPSMAGVVASVDSFASQYIAKTHVQPPRLEIITGLKDMLLQIIPMFNQYRKYKEKADIWPEQLIIFRDGVSEGELQTVVDEEFAQIKDAIRIVWAKMNMPKAHPKVTLIVVGKRHHIRFKPRHAGTGDRSGNCPAGFVVDDDITSPGIFDFYLLSQAGLLGTSRPSHYIVVKDENKFPSDSLQSLCYALCHTYARATRSVSIPAPVYYADIVCDRADYHFDPNLHFLDDASSGDGQEFDMTKWDNGYRPINRALSTNMYFM